MISGFRSTLNKLVLGLALFGVAILPVHGQSDERPENWEDNRWRWFEVEVLVVRYTEHQIEDEEVFPLPLNPIAVEGSRDLLTPALRANIRPLLYALPQCEVNLLGEPVPKLPVLEFLQLDTAPTSVTAEPHTEIFAIESVVNQLSAYGVYDTVDTERPVFTDPVLCVPHKELIVVNSWYNDWQPNLDIELERSPIQVTAGGGNIYTADIPFLISEENLDLQGVRERLTSRPGVEPLLHTAWRQPVFGRTSGRKTRLFGGENFTGRFSYDGFAIPEEEPTELRLPQTPEIAEEANEMQSIERVLQAIEQGDFSFRHTAHSESGALLLPELQPMPAGVPEEVWEFDGLMHIYLVGNFLHIDSEFNLREPVPVSLQGSRPEQQLQRWYLNEPEEAEFLRGYYFKQLRRVISHQLHYFDHPRFGVLVEIRRTDLSRRR